MKPTPKQAVALLLPSDEVFYGGAVGGAKSLFLLISALQYVDKPEYRALILRRTYAMLAKSGALIDEAHKWLGGIPDAVWREGDHSYYFPSGARLEFGHMQREDDKYSYQSAQYHFIGFDQVEQFTRTQYEYMFSRLRRTEATTIPTRMRATANPGGIGFEWVKKRFVDPGTPTIPFVPAKLADNMYLDKGSYIKSLSHLDAITLRQLLDGDWTARHIGGMFKREKFRFVDAVPADPAITCRSWDLAATSGENSKRTAGVLMSRTTAGFYIRHCVAGKWTPGERDNVILSTAKMDGKNTAILIELEPGSGGIAQFDTLAKLLVGYRVISIPPSANKGVRAGPFSSATENGHVSVVDGQWNRDYIDEHEAFTGTKNDGYVDRVDASSMAYNWLSDQTIYLPSATKPEHEILQDRYRRDLKNEPIRETYGGNRGGNIREKISNLFK